MKRKIDIEIDRWIEMERYRERKTERLKKKE